MIVKKDISYLSDKVKDLDWIFDRFGEIFDNGGKLGGGLLRRTLFDGNGSLKSTSRNFVSRTELAIPNIHGLRKPLEKRAVDKHMNENHTKFVDIDFFFESKEENVECMHILEESANYVNSSGYANTYVFVEEEKKGFAFTKVQLVKPEISVYQKIDKILSDFDFINCAMAIDKHSVWFHKDYFEKNNKKILSCSINHKPEVNFFSRVEKYLEFNDSVENHVIPTIRTLKAHYQERQLLKLLRTGKFMNKDEMLCLYGTCGDYSKIVNKLVRFSTDCEDTVDFVEKYETYQRETLERQNLAIQQQLAAVSKQPMYVKGRQMGKSITNAMFSQWQAAFKGVNNV